MKLSSVCQTAVSVAALSTVVLSSEAIAAPSCVAGKTSSVCAGMGYTLSASDCTGISSLSCPFDDEQKWCRQKPLAPSKTCAVGDILYSDNQCYTLDNDHTLPAGVSPEAIVFDTTNKLAVSWTYKRYVPLVSGVTNTKSDPTEGGYYHPAYRYKTWKETASTPEETINKLSGFCPTTSCTMASDGKLYSATDGAPQEDDGNFYKGYWYLFQINELTTDEYCGYTKFTDESDCKAKYLASVTSSDALFKCKQFYSDTVTAKETKHILASETSGSTDHYYHINKYDTNKRIYGCKLPSVTSYALDNTGIYKDGGMYYFSSDLANSDNFKNNIYTTLKDLKTTSQINSGFSDSKALVAISGQSGKVLSSPAAEYCYFTRNGEMWVDITNRTKELKEAKEYVKNNGQCPAWASHCENYELNINPWFLPRPGDMITLQEAMHNNSSAFKQGGRVIDRGSLQFAWTTAQLHAPYPIYGYKNKDISGVSERYNNQNYYKGVSYYSYYIDNYNFAAAAPMTAVKPTSDYEHLYQMNRNVISDWGNNGSPDTTFYFNALCIKYYGDEWKVPISYLDRSDLTIISGITSPIINP